MNMSIPKLYVKMIILSCDLPEVLVVSGASTEDVGSSEERPNVEGESYPILEVTALRACGRKTIRSTGQSHPSILNNQTT